MKNSIFRLVRFWKASLMTLPVNVFFDLMRTTFGKIKTPFNKQILLNDLEKFLSKKDIQDIIAGYLDQNDSRIIAAIAALDEPTVGELEVFFDSEINTAELHTLIVNLEERFIVYRFRDEGKNRLSLNPVLEPVLSPVAADRTLLFESVSPDDVSQTGKKDNFIFDDRILAALFSFVSQNEMFYRKGGNIRQKITGEIAAIFPGIPAEAIIGGLRVLGLFVKEGEQLLPDYQRLREFGDLGRRERVEYCAAGVYYFCHTWVDHSFSSRLLRQKFSDLATFIHSFFDSLDPERLYTTATLRRIVYIINRSDQDDFFTAFTGALEKTGLLVPVSKQYWCIRIPAPEGPLKEGSPSKEGVAITTDSPYSFLVYPEITYNDVTALAAFSRVTETGATARFELNRDYVMQAFNRGISADTMIELLQRLSHNRIDENLIFTLRDWEKRHGEVRLLSGIVLTLSPERRYLAETQPLAALISQTLAPGIHLLPQEAEEKASAALRKAGASISTGQGNNGADTGKPFSISSGGFYQPLSDEPYITASTRRENAPEENRKKPNPTSTLIGGFRSILEKMPLGGEERAELADRIDRRLILCESQLKDAVVRYEKLEARGLDYTGKSLIAKQAISLQTPVEIYLSGRKKDGRVFGIPKALEKTDGDSILTVEQSGENFRIPLGKISLLRRVKKSIFENDT